MKGIFSIGKLAGASVLVFADGNAIPGNASVSVRAVDVETAVSCGVGAHNTPARRLCGLCPSWSYL